MNKRHYFNDLASRWDRLPTAPDARERTACFIDRMQLARAQRVLDVGCGTGVLVSHLRRALAASARLVELDFADSMVRECLRAHAAANVAGLCADAAHLPLASDSFDAVLCFNVLPHLGDPENVATELLRVLRPGGVLGVGHLMDSSELNAFHQAQGSPVAGDHLPSALQLRGILEGAGASTVVAEERSGWYFVRATRGAR